MAGKLYRDLGDSSAPPDFDAGLILNAGSIPAQELCRKVGTCLSGGANIAIPTMTRNHSSGRNLQLSLGLRLLPPHE